MARRPEQSEPYTFHSKFGGMWIDRSDFPEILAEKLQRSELTHQQAEQIREFEKQGYIILRNAVDPRICDEINQFVEDVWAKEDSRIKLDILGKYAQLAKNLRDEKVKLLDLYWFNDLFLKALLSKPIVDFLKSIFEENIFLFQSLSFENGTEQAIHQDTAYVVVDQPMKLAASWIALQDIQPGTGELTYFEGSHRLPDFEFGKKKNWNRLLNGEESHNQFLQWLQTESKRRGLNQSSFLPKKGDVLIWHADLAHGGSTITNRAKRLSLVGHYCPQSCSPFYFNFLKRPEKRKFEDSIFASFHYQNQSKFYKLFQMGKKILLRN